MPFLSHTAPFIHLNLRKPQSNRYSVRLLAKFDRPLAKSILDPHDDKYSDVSFLRFYFAGYIAYIKIDHKPTPKPFSQFAMAENRPLHIICRDFEKSKELKLMVNMRKSNQQAKRLR